MNIERYIIDSKNYITKHMVASSVLIASQLSKLFDKSNFSLSQQGIYNTGRPILR